MKKMFVIGNEYRTGILIDRKNWSQTEWDKRTVSHQPDGTYNLANGICNGLRVVGDIDGFNGETLDRISGKGRTMTMVDTFRCQKETVEELFRKMREYPENSLWLCPFGERDGCFYEWTGTKNDYFSTRAEAAEYYRRWLCGTARTWVDPNRYGKLKFVRDCASPLLPLGNIARHIEAGSIPKWANMAAHSSACYAIHYYYEWGFRMVWVEQGVCLDNLQVTLAFLRGAARQHGAYFGIDFSSWGGLPDVSLPVFYDEAGRRQCGTDPSYLLEGWLTCALNGANFVFQEVSEHAYFLPRKSDKDPIVLSDCGKKAEAFADFALKRHPDRGEPHIPVAVMLEHDHGWNPMKFKAQHFVWGGKVPYESGDYMIEHFFEYAYPGYKYSAGSYEPGWNPEAPWKTFSEYHSSLLSGGDMRPYNRGKITPSHWSDGVDVIIENASVEAMMRYPVIVLLGRLKVTPDLEKRLEAYVKAGGTLVLTSTSLGCAWELAGVAQSSWGGWVIGEVNFKDGATFFEQRHIYAGYAPAAAEVIACNRVRLLETVEGTGTQASSNVERPVVFRHKLGKGQVYLHAAEYGMTEQGWDLLQSFKHLLDLAVAPHQLVRVEGAPLHVAVNLHPDRLWVSAFNHSREPWQGELVVAAAAGASAEGAMDIWTDTAAVAQRRPDGSVAVPAEIEPFAFKVFEIKKAR